MDNIILVEVIKAQKDKHHSYTYPNFKNFRIMCLSWNEYLEMSGTSKWDMREMSCKGLWWQNERKKTYLINEYDMEVVIRKY